MARGGFRTGNTKSLLTILILVGLAGQGLPGNHAGAQTPSAAAQITLGGVEPQAGTWKPWVLSSGSQFRPRQPFAYDSAEKIAELDEVKHFPRTFDTSQKALLAQTGEGIFSFWYRTANRWIFEDRLDTHAPWVARAYALMSVAHHDAMVACWDAKYAYWAIRPFQLDPDVKTLFPTPNHPSYPAAHGCGSGAIAAVMAYLFPRGEDFIRRTAGAQAWRHGWDRGGGHQ